MNSFMQIDAMMYSVIGFPPITGLVQLKTNVTRQPNVLTMCEQNDFDKSNNWFFNNKKKIVKYSYCNY